MLPLLSSFPEKLLFRRVVILNLSTSFELFSFITFIWVVYRSFLVSLRVFYDKVIRIR